MSEAWIRIVIYETDLKTDEHLAAMKENTQRVVTILRAQPGFSSGYWGHDPKTKRMSAVTYWTSLQAMEDAGKALQAVRAEREKLGVRIHSMHTFQLHSVAVDIDWDYADAGVRSADSHSLRPRVGLRRH